MVHYVVEINESLYKYGKYKLSDEYYPMDRIHLSENLIEIFLNFRCAKTTFKNIKISLRDTSGQERYRS